MKNSQILALPVLLFLLFFAGGVTEAQNPGRSVIKPGSELHARSKKNESKVREPRAVEKAKKKQEANERRLKKEYEAYIKESKKRSYEIQTPEVQERMKANRKESDLRYKSKKKKISDQSKKIGRAHV